MSANISQLAAGLKVRLNTIAGLRTFTYQPEQIQPPVAYPVLDSVNYHKSFGNGIVSTDWSIYIIVGRYTDSRAHELLDGFLSTSGATSVITAIEGDKTLGGTANTLILNSGASIQPQTQGDAEFLTVRFSCLVYS